MQIIDLRHKLAAHSANYDGRDSGRVHTFVPVQIELDDFKCSYSNYNNDEYHTVDLKKAIEEHLKLMCKTYIKIIEKSVATIYKSNPEKIDSIMEKVKPFAKMTEGSRLLKNVQTGEFILINYTTK